MPTVAEGGRWTVCSLDLSSPLISAAPSLLTVLSMTSTGLHQQGAVYWQCGYAHSSLSHAHPTLSNTHFQWRSALFPLLAIDDMCPSSTSCVDADACVPHNDNEQWTSGLGLPVKQPWRPWLVNQQVPQQSVESSADWSRCGVLGARLCDNVRPQ
jgi:hypothetical protein